MNLNKITRINRHILRKLLSDRSQLFYEKILDYTLQQMGYGSGADCETSGETQSIQYVAKELVGNPSPHSVILFDCGANIGVYTKSLIDIFGESAQVHAFEPSKQTFQKLKDNIGERKNVKLNNVGCSDHSCVMPLFTDAPVSGLTSVYNRRLTHFNIKLENIEKAHFTTLDNYCRENNISHIDFLKLDVEGHELNVLAGAEHLLNEGGIRFIQFEFGGCNIDSRTFFQDFWYLLHDNFHIYRILSNGLYEIRDYSENLEIFKCVNFLAKKR